MAPSVRIIVHIFWIVAIIGAAPRNLYGDSISTAEIIARSHSVSCLDWKISGVCIWLKCTIFGCYITTTPRISHRLPDLVFQAYPNSFDPPWQSGLSYEKITGKVPYDISGGKVTGITTSNIQPDSLQFNEVDAIGNPTVNQLKIGRFLCKSAAKALYPYYISVEDALSWRSGDADANKIESVTQGLREIGHWPNFTWGSVYPRTGFLIQNHPGKAAAVSCQRAADIVLRDHSGHLVRPLAKQRSNRVIRGNPKAKTERECNLSGGFWDFNPRGDSGPTCRPQRWLQWLPYSDERNDKWQMIYPLPNDSCETFGQDREFNAERVATDGKYIWNYWGKYKCCVDPGGKLIKAFDF